MSRDPAPAYAAYCEACRQVTPHAYYNVSERARCCECWSRFWEPWLSLTQLQRDRLKYLRHRVRSGQLRGDVLV